MLGGLEDQAESVMQPREACRCAAVGETRQGEVRRRVVVTIVINRYSQEVSSSLTAQQRGAPVVANTAGVAEVVTPILNKPGTRVARVEGVDADNTHLRITGRDLPVCRPHVVRREDHPGDRNVHTPGLQDHGVAHIGHVREGARGHCLARTNKMPCKQGYPARVSEVMTQPLLPRVRRSTRE